MWSEMYSVAPQQFQSSISSNSHAQRLGRGERALVVGLGVALERAAGEVVVD